MVDSVACEWFGRGMKAILFSLFVGLLIVGCGESSDPSDPSDSSTTREVLEDATADAVDWSKLEWRNWVMYLQNEEIPFTGRAKRFYKNGQKQREQTYKEGKLDGLDTSWYENGQKQSEGNYKEGKVDGLYTSWYENGQKKEESNWRDGKLMSAEVWKPNGEKCPVTNIDEDGNGVWLEYKEDGTESYRYTYKDGELVED